MALMTKARAQLGIPGKKPRSGDATAVPGVDELEAAIDGDPATGGMAEPAVDADPAEAVEAKKNWWQRRQEMKKLEGRFDS